MDVNQKAKLTAAVCRATPLPEQKAIVVWDTEIPGFGLRVTPPSGRFPNGTKSFVLNYRNDNNRERRATIGRFDGWSPERARKAAKALKQAVAEGGDPVVDKREKRHAPTMNDLCDRYLDEHARVKKRPKSIAEDESMIRRIIRPRLGTMKVSEARYADVDRLHRSLRDTPFRANRVVALLSKMFALAIRWQIRTDNPAGGIERFAEEPRERPVKREEINTLFEALNKHADQDSANIVRLLLLTGARRGEALSATWGQFDLTAGVWSKPSSHTKQKKVHHAQLGVAALELLARLRETANDVSDDDLVFPGRGGVVRPDINGFWRSIRKATGLRDVRIHDLRHTFASYLASGGAGLSLSELGKVMGHTQAQTTLRYLHHFPDPLKAAVDSAGAAIIADGTGEKGAEVIPFKGGK